MQPCHQGNNTCYMYKRILDILPTVTNGCFNLESDNNTVLSTYGLAKTFWIIKTQCFLSSLTQSGNMVSLILASNLCWSVLNVSDGAWTNSVVSSLHKWERLGWRPSRDVFHQHSQAKTQRTPHPLSKEMNRKRADIQICIKTRGQEIREVKVWKKKKHTKK